MLKYYEEIIKGLIAYSFEDIVDFSDLTREEQRIIGTKEHFEKLRTWTKDEVF